MTLDEAIKHTNELCENDELCDLCKKEHVELKTWLEELKEIKQILGDEYDLNRLAELVKADKEGRCVTFP